jgi:DNA-binding YbaB/EbfC family protein
VFKEFSQLAGLMGKLPKIKEEFARFQERAGDLVAEGKAGGDMVTVRVNGKFTVVGCRVSDEVLKLEDREVLEDLFTAATNQALAKIRQMLSEEAQKAAADIGLPPGFSLPGLG